MAERLLISGNEAVGWGAILGECKAFFGYPIHTAGGVLAFGTGVLRSYPRSDFSRSLRRRRKAPARTEAFKVYAGWTSLSPNFCEIQF